MAGKIPNLCVLCMFTAGFGFFKDALPGSVLWARGKKPDQVPLVIVKSSENRTHYYSTTDENEESDKLVIGREYIEPGVELYFGGVFIFEGGLRDTVYPSMGDLATGETVVHIEARANWNSQDELPPGAVSGGFVPYLNVRVEIENQSSGYQTSLDLSPHINLENNLHYARNVPLPGEDSDLYSLTFVINSAMESKNAKSVAKPVLYASEDWEQARGLQLFEQAVFRYRDVAFEKIAGTN